MQAMHILIAATQSRQPPPGVRLVRARPPSPGVAALIVGQHAFCDQCWCHHFRSSDMDLCRAWHSYGEGIPHSFWCMACRSPARTVRLLADYSSSDIGGSLRIDIWSVQMMIFSVVLGEFRKETK